MDFGYHHEQNRDSPSEREVRGCSCRSVGISREARGPSIQAVVRAQRSVQDRTAIHELIQVPPFHHRPFSFRRGFVRYSQRESRAIDGAETATPRWGGAKWGFRRQPQRARANRRADPRGESKKKHRSKSSRPIRVQRLPVNARRALGSDRDNLALSLSIGIFCQSCIGRETAQQKAFVLD